MRNYLDEEEIDETKKKFNEDLLMHNNSLFNIINKDQQLNNIIQIINVNQKENDKLFDLLINDYYTLFLNNCLNKKKNKKEEEEEDKLMIVDNIDNNKQFLNLMTILRANKMKEYFGIKNEKDIVMKLAENINWIESYTEEISSIQQIFLKLSMKIPEFYEQIEEIINQKQIIYEISDRNPEYTSVVNEAFFLSLDSILRIITSKEDIYDLPQDDFFDLINTNREVLQNALELEANLNLRSKEVFFLQEILKLINAFYMNNIANIKSIKRIIQYFGSQTELIQKKKQGQLSENFKEFYEFLVKNLGNLPTNKNFNFYKILGEIFLNEFMKISYDGFRELLLEIILKNNNLIKNCIQIIKILFENILERSPPEMKKNLQAIKDNDSNNIKKLNDTNSLYLEEVIMNIFEIKLSVYFESIPKLEPNEMKDNFPTYYKDKKEVGIIFDTSFEIFQNTLQFLNSYSKNKKANNGNLCKLFSLTYVKMYLSKLVTFIFKHNQKMPDIKKIMGEIKKLDKNFSKVIKIYIMKLFYNLMDNNFEQFQAYPFQNIGIDFSKEFNSKTEKEKKQENMLTFFFLPLEEEDYLKYTEESKLFLQNSNFDPSKKEIANSIEKDGIDTFLCISINKIVSNLGLQNYETKNPYKKFSLFAKSVFSDINRLKLTNELPNLLYLFYDSQKYESKMKPKILSEKKIPNQKVLEILLYGFRYCVNSLNCKDNGELLFKSLLTTITLI